MPLPFNTGRTSQAQTIVMMKESFPQVLLAKLRYCFGQIIMMALPSFFVLMMVLEAELTAGIALQVGLKLLVHGMGVQVKCICMLME